MTRSAATVGNVGKANRGRAMLIIAAMVCLSVLAGCLLGTIANRLLPVESTQREIEAPARGLNRLT
ncbi:MAG: hypothetical protein GX592_12335 [Clostridiales bacterium]|nr:hypothetical protein [Clostridiales bacterium]